jgi:hypothetical protein
MKLNMDTLIIFTVIIDVDSTQNGSDSLIRNSDPDKFLHIYSFIDYT